jgi:signal transduction histidine kinase
MGNITAVAIFCIAYGAGLLVYEPVLRTLLEKIAFIALSFMGPFFIAFGLEYTGRGGLLRTPLGSLIAGVPVLTTLLVATNPLHGFVWRDFRLAPAFGAATVQYNLQPWAVFALVVGIVTGGVGSLVLIDAIVNYGRLYRREAAAVILSTVPVFTGVLLWLFQVGPVPQLHLTSVLMLGHLACDSYAFVGTHMFESSPATQRAAERSALDDLNEPLLVVDTTGDVVNLNSSAEALFEWDGSHSFPVSVASVTGVDRTAMLEAAELRVDGRLFALSQTPLTDRSSGSVGELLVLYDITTQRQREERLSVLNRVLRHNLRNEMTVIRGRAETMKTYTESDPVTNADSIIDASDRLLSIVGNIRDFERVLDGATTRTEIDLQQVTEKVSTELRDSYPEATIHLEVSLPNKTVSTDAGALELALQNLIENAIVHSETATPQVSITLSVGGTGAYRITIEDTNPKIPDTEQVSLQAGQELPLQHGKGLGLWTVSRCVTAVDGELQFQYDDGNRITLTLSSD